MSPTEKQTKEEAKLRLAAARLLLGDELALRLVNDQWNAVNELSDPYEEEGNTGRFNIEAAGLAAMVVGKMCDALHDPLHDLGERKIAAMGKIPDEERKAWFKNGGPAPEVYAKEVAAPFYGDPRIILREMIEATVQEGEFRRGTPAVTVICKMRADGSAWISVGNVTEGPHFQCDFYGDIAKGPVSIDDFACAPPKWVLTRLGLSKA